MNLETLAHKMMLTPIQAIALPQVITTASKSQKVTEPRMIALCNEFPKVSEYLASICRTVTK